jgi:hypothetical protein
MEENIKTYLKEAEWEGVEWIYMVQDGEKWGVL